MATLFLLFFALSALGADYQSGVSATVLKSSSVTGNGQKIVYPVTDKAQVTAMTVTLAPGAATGWHSHPIPVYAYVVEGKLDVELEGGQVITYRSGDAIIEVVNTLHNGINQGSEAVRLVVFYTGAEDTPNVVKPAAPSLPPEAVPASPN
ncbi:MAG TPA: cupin domain-containing protein [Geomobilimonas sp.]|nr:cupin domain-containing protein [Geomobilimonas sp.]